MGPKHGEIERQGTLKTGSEKRDNNNANKTTANRKPYMVLPYVKELSESMKMYATNMGYRYITKEEIPSKAS